MKSVLCVKTRTILSNINKVLIIGFPKCGSSSLRTYLRKKFINAEVTSFPNGVSLYNPEWKSVCLGECKETGTLSVIIIRDPYERIWSAYWWSKKWGVDISFEEFLSRKGDGVTLSPEDRVDISAGISNPVEACDFWKYIKKAEACNPLILRFEDMIRLGCFPHEAKTDGFSGARGALVKPKLDNKSIKLIREAFDREGIQVE